MLPLITPDDTNPPYQPPAYLIDAENRPFPHMFQQNFFLEMLNENINELVTALGADNIYVLYGNGAPETDLGYKVSQLRGTNLWRHGIPIAEVENSEGNGDDLIPWESTTLFRSGLLSDSLPRENEEELDASEDALPMRARHKEIMYHPDTIERWVPAFLGVIDHDNADARLPFTTPYQLPGWALVPNGTVDLISVVSACPVNLLITDPQGRRLGFDPATGQVLREIPHSIYTIPGSEPQIVVMANPYPGTYQVTASGYADGEFALRADYIANNGAFLLDGFAGTTTAGQIDTYTFVYDPTIPAPPQVDAGINTTGVVNQSVTFSGSFTDINPGDTHTIDWAFGDGATATGTLSPTHTYSSTGVYTATLTVDDNTGFVISDTLQVQIIDPAAGNADLTAQYRVGESGDTSATNSDIKPFLNLVNSSTTDISLSELTVRYWYTIDTDQSQSYACDWAVVDCATITHQFVPLTNPRNGADHYLELGFTSGAGVLSAGGSSGDIQSRITKTDFSNYDETDDYSFDPTKTSYTDWTQVTLYRNGVLIWGTEPAEAISSDLALQYRVGESGDTSASNSDIKPFLNLVNNGTTDIPLSELTVRYWYTIDTDQSQSYACDWAVLDCANITHQFVPLTNPRNGADHYLELGFTSSAGTLPGGGSSGDIQSRITKTDFSNYDETDDYSFDPMKTSYTDWTHVTLYRNGVLIWGTEPN
jgi:PKD repeat protein